MAEPDTTAEEATFTCSQCGPVEEVVVEYRTTVALKIRDGEPWSVTVDDQSLELGTGSRAPSCYGCGTALPPDQAERAVAIADTEVWPAWEIGY